VYESLSEAEVQAIHDEADKVFTLIDLDGDGEISRGELEAHLSVAGFEDAAVANLWLTLDVAPQDGVLSRAEFREAFVRYEPLREAPGLGAYGAEFVEVLNEEADAIFDFIDCDDNNRISLPELRGHLAGSDGPGYAPAAVEKIFEMLDTNSDGDVSRQEFREAFVRSSAMRVAVTSVAEYDRSNVK